MSIYSLDPPASSPRAAMTKPSKSWRDVIKVHPAADLFPRMSADEQKALGEDIRKNGLVSPIAITLSGGWGYRLIDGRNRLDAMELVGIDFTLVLKDGECWLESDNFHSDAVVIGEADAIAYVVSANIHRRHLTADQKRELIATAIKTQPSKSNRQIAKTVGVSHPHVAVVRAELEKSGDVETVTTSVDTKGRKQPTHKQPTRKKRRNVDNYLAEKQAEAVSAKATETTIPNRIQPCATAQDMANVTPLFLPHELEARRREAVKLPVRSSPHEPHSIICLPPRSRRWPSIPTASA